MYKENLGVIMTILYHAIPSSHIPYIKQGKYGKNKTVFTKT
jgi:hypothetical protein